MPYTTTEIKQRLADHPNWTLGDDGQLHAEYTLGNFMQVMLLANAIGHLAQAADHHPDLFIHSYKNLRVSIMTHSAGGITDKDFALIRQIDSLPQYD